MGRNDLRADGLVFVLIGLHLPYVMAGIHSSASDSSVVRPTFSALLMVLRLMWMFPHPSNW